VSVSLLVNGQIYENSSCSIPLSRGSLTEMKQHTIQALTDTQLIMRSLCSLMKATGVPWGDEGMTFMRLHDEMLHRTSPSYCCHI